MEFARQHLPEEATEVEHRHNETYEKFHKRNQERIGQLEKQEQDNPQEQVA